MQQPLKTWYITGASRGLGRAITAAALEAGDHVFAAARRAGALADLAARYPHQLRTASVDVTDIAAVQQSIDNLMHAFGRVDVVVNNAGYANLSAIEDTAPEDFRAQVDTNLFGAVNVTQAVLPVLRAQGRGRIINVSSVGGRVANAGLGAYQAAKWALNGFTEVLATEVGPLGIKVTAIEPGGMRTDWAGASMAIPPISEPYRTSVGVLADLFETGSVQAAGDPARVAQAIVRLSELADPPVRLLLGSDALAGARAAAKALADSDSIWQEFSRTTDHLDATTDQLDPLGAGRHDPAAVVHRFIDEVVNGGNIDAIDELWHPDLRWHAGSLGDIEGIEAYKVSMRAAVGGAFTGMHLTAHDTLVDGDTVVARFTNSGTHTGPFMGTPATGRYAQWLGIGIYTVRDGKIAEAWFGEDILGMLQQLGAITLPA
ncbi:SDR family NAD(P)-dependent oxidoreductase [Streptomyces sp. NPDC046977]|uniref:SDR family NAD(P)-dependent oxidoreductase n=1 Tax=Streptomyces sp. NPDC046977 TaxID=3154703 RepID=UPI0033ED8319